MDFTPARPSQGCPIGSSTPLGDAASHDSGYASFVFQKPQHEHDSLQVDSPHTESGQNLRSQSLHEEDSLLDTRTPKAGTLGIPRVRLQSTLHKRRDQQGRLHVDFLKELRSFEPILAKLLSMLEEKDLAAVCHTSATWRCICLSIKPHAVRWRRYIQAKRDIFEANRENLPHKKFHRVRNGNAEPLSTVNSGPTLLSEPLRTDAAVPAPSSRHGILAEGSTKKEEVRHLCPTCGYPSGEPSDARRHRFRATNRTGCHCTSRPVAPSAPCGQKQSVGSKASKRNLRRL